MQPSYDDLADTVTANLRTMRATAIKMDALANLVFSVVVVAAIVFSILTVSKLLGDK